MPTYLARRSPSSLSLRWLFFAPLAPLATLALASCSGGGGAATPAPATPGNPPQQQPQQPTQPGQAAFARLWAPNYAAGELRAWNRGSLQADRENSPDVTITLPVGTGPNALTFGPDGAMWVSDVSNDRLLRFGRAQLATSGSPVPEIVIDTDGTSIDDPIGIRFDAQGNLWVACGGKVEMFEPGNLDQSGPTTANRTLTYPGADLPAGLLFDSSGNLWVTNASYTVANNFVAVFTPAQLATAGNVEPQLVIESTSFALCEGIQFDRNGDLWVASNDGLNVSRFTAAQVAVPAIAEPTPRELTPVAALTSDLDGTPSGRTVRKAGGIVFDSDGNLFVNSQRGALFGTDSAILQFRAAQLTFTQGQNVPAAVLVSRSTSNPGFGGLLLELP
jgi:streptogramin lyase